MTIEFVDPAVVKKSENTEKKVNSSSKPKPVSEIRAKKNAPERPKRLVEIDGKLAGSLAKLEGHLEKAHDLNTRLFGNDKAKAENQRDKSSTQNKGLVTSIDTKVDELDDLLAQLDTEIAAVDALA